MASKTEICNIALSHLNIGKEIANVDTEQSQEASACRRFFETSRDATLRDFSWPFATRFATLALVEDAPTVEWEFSYRYPSDCLKIRRIVSGYRNDNRQQRVEYKISSDDSGTLVFCNVEDPDVEYTALIDNPGLWPSDFVMAFSFRLASYIAPRLTSGDPFGLADKCLKMYAFELSKAQANGVNEEQVAQDPEAEIIRSRE